MDQRISKGYEGNVNSLPIETIVARICEFQEGLSSFWSEADGWAPNEAADRLGNSRLDWQVSLSRCLHTWVKPGPEDRLEGELILAWVNLGSLVEGTLMLFLSVHYEDYKANMLAGNSHIADPDSLVLDKLRKFVRDNVWTDAEGKKWDAWISHVQQRRNAIHAFRDRPLGTHEEFLKAVRTYLEFLRFVDSHFPYP